MFNALPSALLTAAFAGGAGVAAAALAYALAKESLPRALDRGYSAARRAREAAVSAARERARAASPEEQVRFKGMAYGSAAGALAGLLGGLGTPLALKLAAYGFVAGGFAGWFVARGVNESRRTRLLRELAVLYEAVLFFTQAGYTIPQALELGSVATPGLRPHVARCLSRYTRDRTRALEQFAQDVALSEATLLASLLVHAEESGMELGHGALAEESRALEELRKSLAEMKVVSKPVYFAVYRALPLVAACGVVVGPLVYRLLKNIQMITNLN